MAPSKSQFDLVGAIMDFEAGEATYDQKVILFQHIYDNNLTASLQGCYGRTVQALLEAGVIKA